MSCPKDNSTCPCCQKWAKEDYDQRSGEIIRNLLGYDEPERLKKSLSEMLNSFLLLEPMTTAEERSEAYWNVQRLNDLLDGCSALNKRRLAA